MKLCTISDRLDELCDRTLGAAGMMTALRELSNTPGWNVPDRVADAIYAAVVYLDDLAQYVSTLQQAVEEAREHEAAGH